MKRFFVSDKCIACGECIVRTNQLVETSDGRATPANNAYIDSSFLPQAQEIVEMCPAGALEIREYGSTTLSNMDGVKKLADVLERRLKDVQIPQITKEKIAFRPYAYSVSYGYADGENQFRYSSESSAKQAANRAFESTFWNHRADYVLSILTQYKSKVLRPYYDFDSKDNYYLGVIDQYQRILNDIRCEAASLTDGMLVLPENSFCVFAPNMTEVKNYTKEYIASFESQYLVKELLDALSQDTYHRLSFYESHFYIDSNSEVIGHNWLGDKLKWTYSFEGVNTEGKDLVKDIQFALDCSEHYGVRYVDDLLAEKINFAMHLFTETVNKEIRVKIEQYRNAVKVLAENQK